MEREPRIGGLKLMLQYIYTGDYSFDVRTANVEEGIATPLAKYDDSRD